VSTLVWMLIDEVFQSSLRKIAGRHLIIGLTWDNQTEEAKETFKEKVRNLSHSRDVSLT
jgi:hypothetical protein